MLIAQAIDTVPASFWKYFCMALAAVIVLACSIVAAYASMRKREPQRLDDNPPIEVRKAPKRYNHEDVQNRFVTIDNRLYALDGPQGQVNQIWTTLRAENAKLKEEMHQSFNSIQRALGRIEGKLDERRSDGN